MVQSRGEPNFTKEAVGPKCGRQVGMQDFYRNVAPVTQVFCKIDSGHTSSPCLTDYPVLLFQRLRQLVQHLPLDLQVGPQSYRTAQA